jgi:hypothetical protein
MEPEKVRRAGLNRHLCAGPNCPRFGGKVPAIALPRNFQTAAFFLLHANPNSPFAVREHLLGLRN